MANDLPQRESRGWLHTALRWHTLFFVLINGFIATINLVFSPATLWFLWVTGTWGMALVVHAFAALGKQQPSAAARKSRSRSRSRRSRERRDEQPAPDDDLGSAPTRLSVRAPSPLSDSSSLQVGQRVADRFVIERALGAGGMGQVFLAHDAVLGDKVALKTIAASLVGSAALERFRREAQAARRITHPNVVRIHDIGQDGALSFISMEYVEGETLAQRIEREGALSLPEIKRIALQLCAALQAAHAAGVVHRDLKPQNVLLDRSAQVRVIDFGLARLEATPGLTATDAVMGTPHYMAPEQLMGQPVDARTDVYAMGCVLHYVLAGVPPFERDSAVAIGMAHCHDTPTPPSERRPELPKSWDTLVMRALEKQPAQRYQSAQELQQALAAL